MTRAFNIEGLVRLQNYMGGKTLSDAQFFAVLNADVVEMPSLSGITRGRYYRQQETGTSITFINTNPTWLNYISVDKNTKRVTFNSTNFLTGSAGSVTTSMLANGAVTSEKLAPGLDVSGLFFTLPEGTKLPYTLTEEDKTKISAATILMLPTSNGVLPFQRGPKAAGLWCAISYVSTIWVATVSENSISAPAARKIVDDTAVRFTPQTLTAAQKTQARTNIGAAEAPNTSGDSQATLEEPPVVDEEPIP